MPSTEILDDLEHLSSSVGADLVLTCDDTVGESLADWISARGGTITDLPALRSLIAKTARTPHDVPPDALDDFPQYLPRTDFYAFRARLRDVLRPEQFSLVDRLYCATFHAIVNEPPATPEDAAATLTAFFAQHRTPGHALTIARAAQAALFTHGLLLKVSIDTLLHGTADTEHRRMTPAEIRSLRAYRTAWRSVAAVLYDADLSKQEIHAVRLDQVTRDGDLIGVDHLPLLDDAKVYLRAQRTYRLITGATASDPLIDQTRQSVAVALRRLGAELNLPAPSNHVPAEAKRSDRWQHNLGVTLLPLVGLRLTDVPPTDPQTEEGSMTATVSVNGAALRERLLRAGLSDRTYANRSGLGDSAVRGMLLRNEVNGSVSIADLRRAATEAGMSMGDLLRPDLNRRARRHPQRRCRCPRPGPQRPEADAPGRPACARPRLGRRSAPRHHHQSGRPPQRDRPTRSPQQHGRAPHLCQRQARNARRHPPDLVQGRRRRHRPRHRTSSLRRLPRLSPRPTPPPTA